MAAQGLSFYNKAKKYLGNGTIQLGTTTVDIHLVTSASNFATKTISTLGSLTSQVSSANGYKQSGKALTGVTWTAGASAGQLRYNSSSKVWTATGGNIANIKGLVLVARTGASGKATANKLLAYASLSSGQFTISNGNTLTINPSATGLFNLA